MKKILLGLLVIAMILTITACSQDQYEKLGDLMGNMSGNIYGIQPNLKDVDTATNNVNNAVSYDPSGNGTVTVKIDTNAARSIVSSVVAVKNSESKKEALKASLSEPLIGSGATESVLTELKTQITAQATESKIVDTTDFTPEQIELAAVVNAVLDDVGASLSANPTKAELATVAVLKTLADAVKSGDEAAYQEAGKAAVDALKITSEIGQVDIFANVSISSLFDMFNEKAISRDGEEEYDMFLPLVGSSISEVMGCITENEKFTEQRYNKFVMECKAMRASYEMIAKAYKIDTSKALSGQEAVDNGLTIEDLGHYIIAVVFSSIENYADSDVTTDFLSLFINGDGGENKGYYAELVEFDMDKLPDFEDDSFNIDDIFTDDIIDAMAGSDLSDYDFSEKVKELLRDEGTPVGGRVDSVLQTIGVILLDSEYESLLSQIKAASGEAEEGSLRCFLYVF